MFMYWVGDNPTRYFWQNRKTHSEFCFFSTEEAVNRHHYAHCVDDWYPDGDDVKWSEENIWILDNDGNFCEFKSPDSLTSEVLAEFRRRYGDDESIIKIDVDKQFYKE